MYEQRQINKNNNTVSFEFAALQNIRLIRILP